MSQRSAVRACTKGVERVEVVLWDFDGVLVRTADAERGVDLKALARLGLHVELLGDQPPGVPTCDRLRELLADAGRPELLTEALEIWRALAPSHLVERVVPYRSADQPLREVPMRTHRFATRSHQEAGDVNAILERFGWRWRFDGVYGPDPEQPDPSPQRYAAICAALGLPGDLVLAVEALPAAASAAREAGLWVAGVPGRVPASELAEAHFVLSHVAAISALLSGPGRGREG